MHRGVISYELGEIMDKKAIVTGAPAAEAEQAEPSFEQAAARIDEIVRLLEKGDAPLDRSLELFEEGARLVKICGKMLDKAEQKVALLQKGADGAPMMSLFDAK